MLILISGCLAGEFEFDAPLHADQEIIDKADMQLLD